MIQRENPGLRLAMEAGQWGLGNATLFNCDRLHSKNFGGLETTALPVGFDRLCAVWSQEYKPQFFSRGSSASATKRQVRRLARHFPEVPEIPAENSHPAFASTNDKESPPQSYRAPLW